MSTPDNAPSSCPGADSKAAGNASPCAGCPNRQICLSSSKDGASKKDPNIARIAARFSNVRRTVVVLSGKGGVGKSTFTATLSRALAGDLDLKSKGIDAENGKTDTADAKNASESGEIGANRADIAADTSGNDDPDGDQFGLGAADHPFDGFHVACVDLDICGPSLPHLLVPIAENSVESISIRKTSRGWEPIYVTSELSVISIAFLLNSSKDAVVWRGPRKDAFIKEMWSQVDYGAQVVDWMILDSPPGTSDEHLAVVTALGKGTKTNNNNNNNNGNNNNGNNNNGNNNNGNNNNGNNNNGNNNSDNNNNDNNNGNGSSNSNNNGDGNEDLGFLTGAIVVTTPQEVSLADVRKELSFCKRTGIKVIGVVENMAGFVCPNCNGHSSIFGSSSSNSSIKNNSSNNNDDVNDDSKDGSEKSGAEMMAEEFGVEYLGSIPLDPRLAMCCENGESFLTEFPDAPATEAYKRIVARIVEKCE